IMLKVIH
ncbi:tetrahydrofolate dehydrogenase/cyclohydrolase, NAD(P)-binding domain protein, partial [Chlamydia psittaci 84-8471/1]